MSKRCNCRATSTSLICRNKMSFLINNKKYCYIHANKIFNKYALYIQTIWYGRKIRNKLQNIYCKLPDELQYKILFYVRESHLIEKHHHSVIRNILSNKIDKSIYFIKIEITPNLLTIDEYNNISQVYYLYNKYETITSLDKISYLKNRVFTLKYFNCDFINTIYDINIQNKYIESIKSLRNNVNVFQKKYC